MREAALVADLEREAALERAGCRGVDDIGVRCFQIGVDSYVRAADRGDIRWLERKRVCGRRGKRRIRSVVSWRRSEIERAENIVLGQSKGIRGIELHRHIAAKAVVGDGGAAAEHAALSEYLRSQALIVLVAVGQCKPRTQIQVISRNPP